MSASAHPNIGAVCVTYNSAEHLEEALAVLAPMTTVVVDNRSSDDSAAIAQRHGSRVTVLPRNIGYAGAANIGVGLLPSSTDTVAFVNPDLRLGLDDIVHLADTLQRNPEIGIVAPRLVFPDGGPQLSARPFPSFRRLLRRAFSGFGVAAHSEGVRADWVIGAAMVVRHSDFVRLGGFDTKFFLYHEDTDLCWRYRAQGLSIVLDSNVTGVHHYARASRRKLALHQTAVRRHWTSIGKLALTYPRDFFLP